MITGMVVMGFGLGALFISKLIAPLLLTTTNSNIIEAFFYIAIILVIIGVPAGLSMKNPAKDFIPLGYNPIIKNENTPEHESKLTVKKSLLSTKFLAMWLIFFLNISAIVSVCRYT